MYTPKELNAMFHKHGIEEKLSTSLGNKVTIQASSIQNLKSTKRSSIYQLQLKTQTNSFPIIFKIYHSSKYKNEVEINIYSKAYPLLKEFLPEIYLMEKQGSETWVFMEYVRQIRGQLTFTPKHFDYIIPTLAKLHAHTYEEKSKKEISNFKNWVPIYNSVKMKKDREKFISKTMTFLDDVKKDKQWKDIIKPHYKSLNKLYSDGPDFFPELSASGNSITHGDLHMQNICSKDVSKNEPWAIQFIDWESAKFAPTWFDMIVLVEILLGFRKDWQSNAEEIRTHAVDVYTNEMKKYGIEFKTKPIHLYKMAYLQRTLEKGLHTQLRRILDNRGGELLPYHLEKISTWGSELGIYK
ncbi:Ecdysteroid kinase [Halobacillus dabanensis]|uniref:Ecdysteroid kinase n=1 Tax=Halobacillus dabanensis TaxID=240302 RepID=A0A1I3W8U8_HALDA|nr:phosphotransferase [Halobacillus dabanensis]SFK03097.1 Ecdysteroid kinase [Halobacillus dabanensis]